MLIALPILAFPDILFGQQTLYWTDLTWIHYPRHLYAAEEWLAGRVPLWDPYEDTGIPLLAESQVGVLYPPSLIFLTPLSPTLELSLFMVGHFSLAALFTLILARTLGLSFPAATLAGLSYGCGGFLMSQLCNLNIMTGAVWLPLIFAATRHALNNRHWSGAILAGLPLALQIFTAQPQIVFYTLIILAGYALYRLIIDLRQQPANRWSVISQPIWLLSLTIATGLLLAAPQLLPTLELQQQSIRDEARDFDFLTNTSLPPVMLLNLVMPSAFGNNVTGFKGGDPFQEIFIYIGFIPLLLIPFSWSQRHKEAVPFFMALLIGGLLLALGKHTPLYEYVIQYLPGFALFRIPARWLMVINLALAILAGFGLQALLDDGLSRRQWRSITLINVALAIILLAMALFETPLLSIADSLPSFERRLAKTLLERAFHIQPIYQDRLLLQWLTPLTAPAILLLANLLISQLLFSLYASQRLTAHQFSLTVMLAITIDLTVAGGLTINPVKPVSWWHELSGGAKYVLEHLDEGRVFPLGMGSEAATVSHLGQYFPSVYRVRSAGGHGSSLRSARYETLVDEADPVQAIQLLGVRYLLTVGQMGADVAATYPVVYQDETAVVYDNPQPLPRAFIVHQAIVADDPGEALAHFQSRAVDPRHTVVLETTGPAIPSLPETTDRQETGQVMILTDQPQMIELTASLPVAGYLVLLDSFYPGWQVTVNQTPQPIYRANYLSRAVYLPAGEHLVRFEYQPRSFQVGLGLAGIVLMGIGLIVLQTISLSSYWTGQTDSLSYE